MFRLIIIIFLLLILLLRGGWHGENIPGGNILLQWNSSIVSLISHTQNFIVNSYRLVLDYCSMQNKLIIDNAEMRKELSHVADLEGKLLRVKVENEFLRDALNYRLTRSEFELSSKIVFASPYDSYAAAYLAAGASSGVKKGQYILKNQVLLGRVESVGMNFASILLISDINSKVPVYLSSSKQRAILAGRLNDYLELLYLDDISQVKIGELILTSGDGQYYPADIVVARVESVNGGKVLAKMLESPSTPSLVEIFNPSDISH